MKRLATATVIAAVLATVTVASADDGSPPAAASVRAYVDRVTSSEVLLDLVGSPANEEITVSRGSNGRLTISSPQGISPLGDPHCIPTSGLATDQISCDRGYIRAIRGDLGGGNDTLTTARDTDVLLGFGNVFKKDPLLPLHGGAGRDRIVGGDAAYGDNIEGGPGRDSLIGHGGPDFEVGGSGNDRLTGGQEKDDLSGGPGADRILGGPDPDLLWGNRGKDRLFGGSGNDYCTRDRPDRVKGCEGVILF